MGNRSKIKLQISYDGSDFCGFQKQATDEKTVQGCLEMALSKLLDEPIQVVGAGRTDKGVHALNSYVHFWTTKDISKYQWTYALNGPLTPNSLIVKAAWHAPDNFHALSSLNKTYKYLILNQKIPSALRRNHMTFVSKELNIERLNEIARGFLGKKDFSSFQTSGSPAKTTIKTVHSCSWIKKPGNVVIFTINADGFLRQMVRNIVGTSLWMERTGAKLDCLEGIFESKDRQQAKDTAPPQGLYLTEVNYPRLLDNKCRRI